MKYIIQILIIGTITLIGEVCNQLIPLPIPASVYGMLLLFFCLMTRMIKPEQIEETADWLLFIMPVLFVSPGVSIVAGTQDLAGNIVGILTITLVTTVVVMIITGVTAQAVIRAGRKGKEEKNQKKQEDYDE